MAQARGLRFSFQGQLGGQETVLLRKGGFRAVDDVVDQLPAVRQGFPAAVDMLGALVIDQQQMVATRPAGNVDVFAQLDVAIAAQDESTPVAPDTESLRREPVDANVAHAAIAAQHDIAKVIQSSM